MSEPAAPNASSLKIYLRLLSHLKPFIGFFLTSILGYIIFSSSQPMMAGILKYFVDGLTASPEASAYNFPVIGRMELIYGVPLLLVLAQNPRSRSLKPKYDRALKSNPSI